MTFDEIEKALDKKIEGIAKDALTKINKAKTDKQRLIEIEKAIYQSIKASNEAYNICI